MSPDDGDDVVPADLRSPDPARRLAAVASVSGERVGVATLAALAALADDDGDARVRSAAGRALVGLDDAIALVERIGTGWLADPAPDGLERLAARVGALRLAGGPPAPGASPLTWREFRPASNALGPVATIVQDRTEIALGGLEPELEGTAIKLLAPDLRAPATDDWAGDWLECDAPVDGGATSFALDPARVVEEPGVVWVVPSPPGRRLIVAIGCGSYDHHAKLAQTAEVLGVVRELFCARLGYRWVDLGLAHSPSEDMVRERLRDWSTTAALGRDDIVAFWFTGHGVTAPDGSLRLLLRDSGREGGLPSGVFARLLADCGVQRALVVADCCHSAPIGPDSAKAIAAALASGVAQARSAARDDHGQVFVGAAHTYQKAQPRAFVEALGDVLLKRRIGGFTTPSLNPSAVLRAVKLPHHEAYATSFDAGEIVPVFPNVHRRDDPADPAELFAHWDPRARGVGHPSDAGWRFTGRERAVRAVDGWITDPAGGAVCLVTGDPGSGKSALLARAVTLADPRERDKAQRAGAAGLAAADEASIACAVHARELTTAAVLARMHEHLLGPAPSSGEIADLLIEGLRTVADAGGDVPVVVVDALDEAFDPAGLGRELAALASNGLVRLLVGSRRDRLAPLQPAAVEIDLDEEPAPTSGADGLGYYDPRDVVAYARRILVDKHAACRAAAGAGTDAGVAAALAEIIARRARKCFLVARVLAEYIARLGALDPAVVTVEADAELGEIVERDLAFRLGGPPIPRDPAKPASTSEYPSHQEVGEMRRLAVDLIRPLAYARGNGLPLETVWALLANAIAGREQDGDRIPDRKLETTYLDALDTYLATASHDGIPSYRLNHEEFVAHFRRSGRLTEEAIERRITGALRAALPVTADGRPDWLAPDQTPILRYARLHLADHAGPAGQLDELLADPVYIVAADPVRLANLGAVRGGGARAVAHVHSRTRHRLPREPVTRATAGTAAAYLELCARQEGYDGLSDRLAGCELEQPWHAPFAAWQPTHPHRVHEGHADAVNAVALAVLGDAPIAMSASYDETLRVWDLRSGDECHVLHGHSNAVNAVACAVLDNTPIAISASNDKTLRVWDLRSGHERRVLRGHTDWVMGVACAVLDDTPIAISASRDQTLRVWDLRSGYERHVLHGHTNTVNAVACAVLDDTPIAISASNDKTLRVWDLRSGHELHLLQGHTGTVDGVACAVLDNTPIAISAGHDQSLRMWDLRSGHERRVLHGHTSAVNGVACTVLDDTPIAVSAGHDRTLRMWDLRSGHQRHALLGHTDAVWGVACAILDDTPIAISASDDATLRVWDLRSAFERDVLQGDTNTVNGVACAVLGDTRIAVNASNDRTLQVWDLGSGRVRHVLYGHTDRVNGVVSAVRDDTPIAISASKDQTLRVWDLRSGHERHVLHGHTGAVNGVACTVAATIVISASDDATLRVWDLDLDYARHVLHGHADRVNGVVCAVLNDTPIAISASADRTLRVWGLRSGREQHVLHGHTNEVSGVATAVLDDTPIAISVSHDQTLRVWDLRSGGPLEGPGGPVVIDFDSPLNAVSIDRDGRIVVAGEQGLAAIELVSARARIPIPTIPPGTDALGYGRSRWPLRPAIRSLRWRRRR